MPCRANSSFQSLCQGEVRQICDKHHHDYFHLFSIVNGPLSTACVCVFWILRLELNVFPHQIKSQQATLKHLITISFDCQHESMDCLQNKIQDSVNPPISPGSLFCNFFLVDICCMRNSKWQTNSIVTLQNLPLEDGTPNHLYPCKKYQWTFSTLVIEYMRRLTFLKCETAHWLTLLCDLLFQFTPSSVIICLRCLSFCDCSSDLAWNHNFESIQNHPTPLSPPSYLHLSIWC